MNSIVSCQSNQNQKPKLTIQVDQEQATDHEVRDKSYWLQYSQQYVKSPKNAFDFRQKQEVAEHHRRYSEQYNSQNNFFNRNSEAKESVVEVNENKLIGQTENKKGMEYSLVSSVSNVDLQSSQQQKQNYDFTKKKALSQMEVMEVEDYNRKKGKKLRHEAVCNCILM